MRWRFSYVDKSIAFWFKSDGRGATVTVAQSNKESKLRKIALTSLSFDASSIAFDEPASSPSLHNFLDALQR
jgi:hypothetical protein